MAPAEKKLKMGEEAPETARKDVTEEPIELEKNAPASKKPKSEAHVCFQIHDTTMNVLSSGASNILKPLSEAGVQYLLAGARANVGMKSGRYAFEVRVLEQPPLAPAGAPAPALRLGFATETSGLLIGDDEESVCFDADGSLLHNKSRTHAMERLDFGEAVFTVLLNLDSKSANKNTISVFKNGVRACPPQPLPKSLEGKTLYPAVTFRLMSVHVNFGEEALAPLPFSCRMIQDADQGDVSVRAALEEPKGGKYDVLYPVGLPSEGVFDWLDSFLKKNPQYTELSGRHVKSWAEKSGLRSKGQCVSNDKPNVQFDIPGIVEGGMLRSLVSAASTQPRHFIVMELQKNLLSDERSKLLALFPKALFKLVAAVVVGEPTADFVAVAHEGLLKAKQAESDTAHLAAIKLEKQKWLAEKSRREAEVSKKRAELVRKKALKEAQKKVAVERKKKELAAKAAKGEEVDEEKELAEVLAEEKGEVDEEVPDAVMDTPEPKEEGAVPPKVTLTAEEKAAKFRPTALPDLTSLELSKSFAKFSLPGKDEGFDAIQYLWSKPPKAEEYVRSWILDRKINTRMEGLVPSPWFQGQWAKWQRTLKEWQGKQQTLIAEKAKRDHEKKVNEAKKVTAAAQAKAAAGRIEMERKKKEAERQRRLAAGEAVEEVEEKEEDPQQMNVDAEAEVEAQPSVDLAAIDPFEIDDVTDVGHGVPLFRDFAQEDWAMLALRAELHLLCNAFRVDAADKDRTGIYLEHLGFYFQLYYKKALSPKLFGVDSVEDLAALVVDTLRVTKQQVMESKLPEEMECWGIFVKITEEARRERLVRLDMGDESVRLKISTAGPSIGGQTGGGQKSEHGTTEGGKPAGGKGAAVVRGDQKRWENKKGGGWGANGGAQAMARQWGKGR